MKHLSLLLLSFLLMCCGDRRMKYKLAQDSASESSFALARPEKDVVRTALVVERKLIKDGSLNFKTADIDKTKTAIISICKTLSAYSSNESLTNLDDRIVYQQTIRVPANGFEELIRQIEKLADNVESKNIESRDVTEEYIDVETRLKTKKEVEIRYREILKQAKTVTEILAIEREIGVVRAEIESMEGKLNYLKDQVSFSTLSITYYERIGTDFGFASKFVDSLTRGWDNLLSFVIGLFSFWPFLIIIGAFTWWIRKRAWRRKQAKKDIVS